jgi:hypothetical protein
MNDPPPDAQNDIYWRGRGSHPRSRPGDSFRIFWSCIWVIWGITGGALLYCADQSAVESSGWLLAGALVGWRGDRFFERVFKVLPDDRPGPPADPTAEGMVDWSVNRAEHWTRELEQRMPASTWQGVLSLGVGFGLLHGLLWGPLLGTLIALTPDSYLSGLQGALLGALVGPPGFALSGIVASLCLPVIMRPPTLEPVRALVREAGHEARRLSHAYVGEEHLLLAIRKDLGSPAARLLEGRALSLQKMRFAVAMWGKPDVGWMFLNRIIFDAQVEAKSRKHRTVRGEHLLLGLLRQPTGVISEVFADLGVAMEPLQRELVASLSG